MPDWNDVDTTDVADGSGVVRHDLAVGASRTPSAARLVGGEESPVWAGLDRVREELLWSWMDRLLTVGALVRVVVAVLWTAMAAATAATIWWGVAMVIGAALSLLHARRGTVLLIADHAGPLAPAVRWLLPYPRVPHVNPIGVLETLGVLAASVGTGWMGAAFDATAGSRAAGSAALAMIFVYDVSFVVNLTGHVTWQFEPIGAFYRRIRSITAPGIALIAMAVLWPSRGLGSGYPSSVVVVLVGTVAMALTGVVAKRLLDSTARTTGRGINEVRRTTQAVDGSYVHQLKNQARILYRRSDEIAAGDLRERVRRLSVAISSTEQILKSGRGTPARCVEDVVNGLLGVDERFAGLRNVDADLDLGQLTAGDAELVAIAVGDLCSNAINANASAFRVGLRAEVGRFGGWLELEAECVCGKPIPEIAEESSLMRLARLLHYNRGSFVIRDDGASHRFILRWPSAGTSETGTSVISADHVEPRP